MIQWIGIVGWLAAMALATPPVSERAPTAERSITVDGLVRLIEYVDVPARRDGRLEKFQQKEGAYVHRGDVLGGLDDDEAQLTLKRTEFEFQLAEEKAKSDIAINSARLVQQVTQNEFDRARQARKTAPGSVSLTEFDRLRLDFEKANSELERVTEEKRFAAITSQTKAVELKLSRLGLEERKLLSPLDGIVVQLHRREGEWVHLGEKVVRIVRIDRLRVEAFVNLHSGLADLENARAVLDVEFSDLPPQQFTGEVVFVNPEADPVNGQIRIWAEISNRDRMLRPGQRGRLKIFPNSKKPPQIDRPLVVNPNSDAKPR